MYIELAYNSGGGGSFSLDVVPNPREKTAKIVCFSGVGAEGEKGVKIIKT